MDNLISRHVPALSIAERKTSELSAETQQLLSLGQQRHWDFQVLGKAPMPDKPVRRRRSAKCSLR